MAERAISVEVVYAGAVHQRVCRVQIAAGSTVGQAIEASGICAELPDGTFDPDCVGIFSRRVSLARQVQQGDRVEIYRALSLTPMEARRRRAR